MRRLVVLGLVLAACSSQPQPPAPVHPTDPTDPTGTQPPITDTRPQAPPPPADAVRLGSTLKILAYAPELTIDPTKTTFDGAITIDVEVPAATSEILLHGEHLTVHDAAITPTGSALKPATPIALAVADAGKSRLRFTAAATIPAGRARIAIRYSGAIDDSDTSGLFRQQAGGAWYAFSQFEALYARRAFPCIDEPDLKVPWTLTVHIPKAMVAVSNALVASDTTAGDTRTIAFEPTVPLPSYLVALGVGRFAIVDAGTTKSGQPIRIIAIGGRGKDAKIAAELTPKIIAYLEDWFGMPYPYPKIDAMAIPITVGFGAMENAGLITYRADLLLMPDDAPAVFKRRYAGVAAHEMSHQWFGDLVTPAWWDDLWLNESFASWLPGHLFPAVFPDWYPAGSATAARARALATDSLTTARSVHQPIATEDDIVSAFDGITYQKGAAVLRMFETWAGEDKWQAGVRAYVTAHANANATQTDFMAAVSKSSGLDITTPMSTFLDQPGIPAIEVARVCTDGTPAFTVAQSRYLPMGTTTDARSLWQIPVCIAYGSAKTRHQVCGLVTKATDTVAGDAADGCGKDAWFYANAGGRGYYYTAGDQAFAAIGAAWSHLDADERIAVAQDLQAGIAAGEVDLSTGLSFVPALVKDGGLPTVELAVHSVDGLRLFLPADDPKVARWVRTTFGKLAKKLGWKAKQTDSPDTITMREQVVALVAELGIDPALRKQAVALAKNWRKLPPGGGRGDTLHVATLTKPALVDAWREDFIASKDRVEHNDLAVALGRVHDRAELEASLALMLDPKVDAREAFVILEESLEDPVTEPWARDWTVAHIDALIARLPEEGSIDLVKALTSSCDAAQVEPMRAIADAKIAPLAGGPREVAQAFERLEQCVSRRHAIEPQIQAWLATLK